jgi:hypothetical protein
MSTEGKPKLPIEDPDLKELQKVINRIQARTEAKGEDEEGEIVFPARVTAGNAPVSKPEIKKEVPRKKPKTAMERDAARREY